MPELSDHLDRLLCGDVLEVLRTLPADAVDLSITSPPYNKGENKKGWLVKNVKYAHSGDRMSEAAYQEWQIEVLNEVYRVTRPGGAFFYNHKIRWERGVLLHPYAWISRSRWTLRQELIWDRKIAANLRGWRFWQVDERIYWLQKPVGEDWIGAELESRHALLTSIWRLTPERNSAHPAPFPLALPVRIIYSILGDRQGGLVLDPFCGIGTTPVAAKLLGHHFIGIDISPEYIALAQARLAQAESERDKVTQELALHRVTKTFAERKAEGTFTGRYGPAARRAAAEQAPLWEEPEPESQAQQLAMFEET